MIRLDPLGCVHDLINGKEELKEAISWGERINDSIVFTKAEMSKKMMDHLEEAQRFLETAQGKIQAKADSFRDETV